MATEVERKFLVTRIPPDVELGVPTVMRQGYLAEEAEVEVRLRITDDTATLTVKAGSGLQRTEVESRIPPGDAEQLWPHTAGRRLDKRRHRIAQGDAVIELDIYAGDLAGLTVAEVEFPDIAAADEFRPPPWFGTELTGRRGWSNAALARHGRPLAPPS